MKLSKRDHQRIAKQASKVASGDLYRALHFVGDDPIKAEIEDILHSLLDEDTFRKVVAVFTLSTGYDV